jgi:hypothetical protein
MFDSRTGGKVWAFTGIPEMALRKLLTGGVLALSLSGCATALGGGLGGLIGHQRDRSTNRTDGIVGAAVAVRFTVPRDIVVAVKGGSETVPVSQATTILGRVVSSKGDTLALELTEITAKRGRERYPSQHSVSVVRDSSTSVQLLDKHPGRTTGIVLGMVVGFVGDVFLLLYALSGDS